MICLAALPAASCRALVSTVAMSKQIQHRDTPKGLLSLPWAAGEGDCVSEERRRSMQRRCRISFPWEISG